MIFLVILGIHFLFGAIGLLITYHRKASPFYGYLTAETILMGLATGLGCFFCEAFALGADKVIFKRKS